MRTTPTVGAIGEAVGIAAAMASRDDLAVQKINVQELQSQLKKQGAFFYQPE